MIRGAHVQGNEQSSYVRPKFQRLRPEPQENTEGGYRWTVSGYSGLPRGLPISDSILTPRSHWGILDPMWVSLPVSSPSLFPSVSYLFPPHPSLCWRLLEAQVPHLWREQETQPPEHMEHQLSMCVLAGRRLGSGGWWRWSHHLQLYEAVWGKHGRINPV